MKPQSQTQPCFWRISGGFLTVSVQYLQIISINHQLPTTDCSIVGAGLPTTDCSIIGAELPAANKTALLLPSLHRSLNYRGRAPRSRLLNCRGKASRNTIWHKPHPTPCIPGAPAPVASSLHRLLNYRGRASRSRCSIVGAELPATPYGINRNQLSQSLFNSN